MVIPFIITITPFIIIMYPTRYSWNNNASTLFLKLNAKRIFFFFLQLVGSSRLKSPAEQNYLIFLAVGRSSRIDENGILFGPHPRYIPRVHLQMLRVRLYVLR